MNTIHCFEERGLGQAPFTYLYCLEGRSSCQYCSTSIRYKFFIRSADGKEFFVGSDCVMKTGDLGLISTVKQAKSQLEKAKREAKKEVQRQIREAEFKARNENRKAEWIAKNAMMQPILKWAENSSGTPKNIFESFEKWGNLSEKQCEYLTKLYDESLSPKPKKDCPVGKVTIEGKVVRFKWVETGFGDVRKMFVESPLGYKVYGTVPGNLNDVSEGDTVRFDATVVASNSDSSFGFYSRPTQAQIV